MGKATKSGSINEKFSERLSCFFFARAAARLSIDLFDRPKMRDMHINKAKFLAFLALALIQSLFLTCVACFYAILITSATHFLRSPPLTWHKLIRWIDILCVCECVCVVLFAYSTLFSPFSSVCAHATNIYYMQSAYYFLLPLKKGDYNIDGLRQAVVVCQQRKNNANASPWYYYVHHIKYGITIIVF